VNGSAGLLVATLACTLTAGCDLVSQFPVIETFPPSFGPGDDRKAFSAVITQNGEAIDPGLVVRCDVFFGVPPTQPPIVASIAAARQAGNVFSCELPEDIVIRNNHVMNFEWVVESINDGQAVPVARSGVRTFHIGCDDPAGFLRNDQATVLARFGELDNVVAIGAAGYLPTHPATAPSVPGLPSPQLQTNKVFKGMGAAFARAVDVPAGGGFVPFGTPVSGDPNLLLFRPSATVAGSPDLADPLATYTLIGWAYAATIGDDLPADRPPSTGCFPLHEWFFHEEGHHTVDGGFTPGPPFSAIGVYHPRLWDLHVWADASGVPRLGILNVTGAGAATTPADGYEAAANSFFYPFFTDPLAP
jgi:hypothetical protein